MWRTILIKSHEGLVFLRTSLPVTHFTCVQLTSADTIFMISLLPAMVRQYLKQSISMAFEEEHRGEVKAYFAESSSGSKQMRCCIWRRPRTGH